MNIITLTATEQAQQPSGLTGLMPILMMVLLFVFVKGEQ